MLTQPMNSNAPKTEDAGSAPDGNKVALEEIIRKSIDQLSETAENFHLLTEATRPVIATRALFLRFTGSSYKEVSKETGLDRRTVACLESRHEETSDLVRKDFGQILDGERNVHGNWGL